MRSTLEIDDLLLDEAIQLTEAKTKKEVVNMALEALVRQKRMESLKNRLGKFHLDLSPKDLEKMREES